ncbi:MAG TPA: hypothetical protein VH560_19095 [Polyangia bacterium]|nr:hypothetical protein [Polyangia bacterium]
MGLVAANSSVAPSTFSDLVGRHAGAAARWAEKIAIGAANLHVEYYPQFDDLRVNNLDVEDQLNPSADVGEAGARAVLSSVVAKLASANIIAASQYDTSTAELGYTKHMEGVSTETVVPQVLQYRFTLRRRINGIDFANAGMRVVVHRDGRLAALRIGGGDVKSIVTAGVEEPTGKGYRFNSVVDSAAIISRFAKETPDARGVRHRLMYVIMPGTGMVEPRHVVFSAHSSDDGHGDIVIARATHAAYSLADASAAPVSLSDPPASTKTKATRTQ